MFRYLFLLAFLSFPAPVFCQETIDDISQSTSLKTNDEVGVLYRLETTYGAQAHSNGFGATFRKGKHLTAKKKRIIEFEMLSMKHPKESKVYNTNRDNPRGYFYGKLFSAFIVRQGLGLQKVVAFKSNTVTSPVEVRYVLSGGASLVLLKPVYLEIISGGDTLLTERFDIKKHQKQDIYGKAPFTKGLDKMNIIPGFYAKLGLSFEHGPSEDHIKILETGIAIDVYYKRVPIMAYLDSSDSKDPNNPYFISLYIEIYLGKKYNN